MVRLSRLVAALGFLALGASSAEAIVCGPRDEIATQLNEKFKEKVVGVGVTADNLGFVEFYQSPDGTWTLVITNRARLSCMLLAGKNWHDALPPQENNTNE